ncbi:MAG: histidinol-phosphate transaminase [Spirochaetaceae bacterium]|nr:histidinol-phosphate transaminase [Spirochaetaceae bacterium]
MGSTKSRFWNSRVNNLAPYIPGEQPKEQLIKLNTNENPYPPPPDVLHAMSRALNEKLRLYPDPCCTEVREAVARRYSVEENQVFIGNGSDEVLAFAFGAFFESAENSNARPILFPEISYSFYPVFAKLWNLPYTAIPLGREWEIKPEDYVINAGGVVLANPNAPTGISIKARDILDIADFHLAHNKLVLVDEAYADFSDDTILPYINDPLVSRDNILVVRTLSKSYSLAGLRVGFAIGSGALITALESLRDSFNSYTIDRVAQAGAAAALSNTAYYAEITKKIIATRERISKELLKLHFTVLPSSANFIFIKHPVMSGEDFFLGLRKNGILVRHFKHDKIVDFVRVTIGTDKDMDIFLEICSAGIKSAQ